MSNQLTLWFDVIHDMRYTLFRERFFVCLRISGHQQYHIILSRIDPACRLLRCSYNNSAVTKLSSWSCGGCGGCWVWPLVGAGEGRKRSAL